MKYATDRMTAEHPLVTQPMEHAAADFVRGMAKTAGKCTGCDNCDGCGRKLSFNDYHMSGGMLRCLYALGKMTAEQRRRGEGDIVDTKQAVDVDGTLKKNEATQLTKLKYFGLVDQPAVDSGNRWYITAGGKAYLRGGRLPETVSVYNGEVVEVSVATMSIEEAEDLNLLADSPAAIQRRRITAEQSRQIITNEPLTEPIPNTPSPTLTGTARYKGTEFGEYKQGVPYEVEYERPVFGRPVKVLKPFEREYKDMAALAKAWDFAPPREQRIIKKRVKAEPKRKELA